VGDTYDPEKSHVIPGLFCKFQHAFENKLPFVECWGTGNALREFLYVSDMAEAAEVVLDGYNDAEPINIGSGEEISIRELTGMIAKIVGYDGEIRWNSDVPDGTPRKLMDNSKIKSLGWKPKIGLESGLRFAYTDFLIRNSWKSKLKNHLG
jgi:GDP-L-fucose synthase